MASEPLFHFPSLVAVNVGSSENRVLRFNPDSSLSQPLLDGTYAIYSWRKMLENPSHKRSRVRKFRISQSRSVMPCIRIAGLGRSGVIFGPISVQLISILDFGSKFPLELSSRRSLSLTAGVPVDPHLLESVRPLLSNCSTYQLAARQATDLYFPSWSCIASAFWRGGFSGKAYSQVISLASTLTSISSSGPDSHIVHVPFPTLSWRSHFLDTHSLTSVWVPDP